MTEAEAVGPDPGGAVRALVERVSAFAAEAQRVHGWRASLPALERSLAELDAQASAVHKTLVVLLVGGTGVGKSTFLNALAHEEIAATSHARRAFTTKLFLYHHAELALDELLAGHAEQCELHPHRAEALRDKVVIDAPDVDSTEAPHRALVESFLPRVDLVIYLTSWQKYKNRDLCRFVAGLRGRHLFTFVLNQIDCVPAEDRALLLEDFERLLVAHGFERPRVLGVSALAVLEGGDGGDFGRLEELLRERIRASEIQLIKQSGLVGRLRALVERVRAGVAAGSGHAAAEYPRALRRAEGVVRAGREALVGALSDELDEVVRWVRLRYERRYHELRERDTPGPYGLFLRLAARLAGDPLDAGLALPRAQTIRVQATLARTLEEARATLRPLGVAVPDFDERRSEELAQRLLDAVRHAADQAYLADLPRRRNALVVNLLPTACLTAFVGWFVWLALSGADPGLSFLVAGLFVTAGVCYAQLALLRAVDRRVFRRRVGDRSPDARDVMREEPLYQELEATERGLSAAGAQLDELAAIAAEIERLRGSLRALPDEVLL